MTTIKEKCCKIYFVLPCYNEEAVLKLLLKDIMQVMHEADLLYHVILIDDGSNDRTFEIMRDMAGQMPTTILRHQKNLGLGMAIRNGLSTAADRAAPESIVVTMDADNTQKPGLVPNMVNMIRQGNDVVIASRYRPGSRIIGVPLSRQFLSYAGSLIFRVLFPIKGVKDYTCGYRAYRAEVLQKAFRRYGDAFIDQEGFQCMVDILLKLRQMNLTFREAPLILRYDAKKGKSKMDVKCTIRDTLLLIKKWKVKKLSQK